MGVTFDDKPNSAYGVARVSFECLEFAAKSYSDGSFSFERKVLDEANPYHGNLLYGPNIPQPQMKMVWAVLALRAEFLPRE